MHTLSVLAWLALCALRTTGQCVGYNTLSFRSPVTVASGLSAIPIFNNLTTPRGIAFDSADNLLVIERGLGLTVFTEHDPACDGWSRSMVVANVNFTQGVQVHGSHLYVSTVDTVYVYRYDTGTRTVSGIPKVIVNGIPPEDVNYPPSGQLTTRPILLHPKENPTHILVSCALVQNIDPTARNISSGRSQVRFFRLSNAPQNFFSGELLAYGIRNPAAFEYFGPDQLWIVDNGASIDNVTGLTAMFVNDNPADELELINLNKLGQYYGFPDCATIWDPTADPVGDPQYTNYTTGEQFSLLLEPVRGDAWCLNPTNNVPPRLSFKAHSVPLDIKFLIPTEQTSQASLPLSWAGDAFVSFHGSFDATPPTGYGVVRVPFTQFEPSASAMSNNGYQFLIQAANLTSCPGTCIRCVGLAFAKDGRLFVSSDSSGELFILQSKIAL